MTAEDRDLLAAPRLSVLKWIALPLFAAAVGEVDERGCIRVEWVTLFQSRCASDA